MGDSPLPVSRLRSPPKAKRQDSGVKEQIKAFIRGPLGSYLISLYLRFVHLTARKVFEPPLAQVAPNGPVVYATWHGQNFIFAFYFRRRRFPTLLVALHGDGKMIGQAMAYLGVRLVFGSGRQGDRGGDKGGARAALQLLKELKNGHSVTLTADVPKIARKAGPGVILIARKAGVPIVPVAMTTSIPRSASSMKALNTSALYEVASTMRVTPASRARVIWCTVKGTPATGSMGLGVLMVRGRSRVP